jgi:hypothetical protein
MYESGSMVLLYILYVGVVVGGNWWSRRRSDKETAKALGSQDSDDHDDRGGEEQDVPEKGVARDVKRFNQGDSAHDDGEPCAGGRSASRSAS